MDSRLLTRIGWALFALGWVPFAGIFIGLIGFPSGSYDWSELPTLTRYAMIATGITFGFSMLILFSSPVLAWFVRRRVMKNGVPAEAELLEVWDTGTTINNNPMVGLRVEVHPKAGPAFIAQTEQLISRLRVFEFKPGAKLKVLYDPATKDIALADA